MSTRREGFLEPGTAITIVARLDEEDEHFPCPDNIRDQDPILISFHHEQSGKVFRGWVPADAIVLDEELH